MFLKNKNKYFERVAMENVDVVVVMCGGCIERVYTNRDDITVRLIFTEDAEVVTDCTDADDPDNVTVTIDSGVLEGDVIYGVAAVGMGVESCDEESFNAVLTAAEQFLKLNNF